MGSEGGLGDHKGARLVTEAVQGDLGVDGAAHLGHKGALKAWRGADKGEIRGQYTNTTSV